MAASPRSLYARVTMESVIMRGAYTADRASALAGVPKSTLHYWARNDILVPSISADRVRLWSWADLVGGRAIYWLRHPGAAESRTPSGMAEVRRLLRYVLAQTAELGEALTQLDTQLFVDRNGKVFLAHGPSDMRRPLGSDASMTVHRPAVINALSEFRMNAETLGPDLRQPRPHLRIIPGKLGGEPHVADTRIETSVIQALHQRDLSIDSIVQLYPDLTPHQIEEAIELEEQLEQNARAA